MNALRTGKIAAAAGLTIFIVSATWFGVRGWLQSADAKAPTGALSGKAYQSVGHKMEKSALARWPQPKAQVRGEGWQYEVFTPPEIFYDAATGKFRVTRVAPEEPAAIAGQAPFGLEVAKIEPEPFPLQLVGYVGEDGNLLGTFENLRTAETLLLRTGDRVPDLGLTIESVTLIHEEVAIPDSMTVRERRVRAVVHSNHDGERTVLNQGEPQTTGRLRVEVSLAGDPVKLHQALAGDVLTDGDNHFTIEKIRLAPPELTVTKETSAPAAVERRTLVPPLSAPAH